MKLSRIGRFGINCVAWTALVTPRLATNVVSAATGAQLPMEVSL